MTDKTQSDDGEAPDSLVTVEDPAKTEGDDVRKIQLIVTGLFVIGVFFLLWMRWLRAGSFWFWASLIGFALVTFLTFIEFEAEKSPAKKKGAKARFALLSVGCVGMVLALVLSWWSSPGLTSEELPLASAAMEMNIVVGGESFGGHGSAFVFEAKDDLLHLYTNAHCSLLMEVAKDARSNNRTPVEVGQYQLRVIFPKGKEGVGKTRPVRRLGISKSPEHYDLAILEVSSVGLVEGEDFVVVPRIEGVRDVLDLQLGDEVIAVGTPIDLELSATQSFGKINNLVSPIDDQGKQSEFIIHDATIAGGSSGGPLFLNRDEKMYWIGINTATLESFNMAISSDETLRAEYVWDEADAQGAVNLLNRVFQVSATMSHEPAADPEDKLVNLMDTWPLPPGGFDGTIRLPADGTKRKFTDNPRAWLLEKCPLLFFGYLIWRWVNGRESRKKYGSKSK